MQPTNHSNAAVLTLLAPEAAEILTENLHIHKDMVPDPPFPGIRGKPNRGSDAKLPYT